MGDEEVGHGEERGVHDAGAGGEDDDGHAVPQGGHEHHTQGVHQLTADVHRSCPAAAGGGEIN